ncbi:MAG: class I SAM-dependent methyltransferase, partial [Nitrososphaeria archaeon]
MILCPKCNNRLSITKDGATCGQHEFLYRDNILELEKSEYYYGEIPQNEMNELLSMIRTEGFFKAVAGYLNCQPQWKSDYLYRYIFSPQRISWLFMTSLRQRRRVLDFGCGWGTLLIPLAKIFDKVIGIDICRERLEFASIRAKEEGIQNIIFVQSGTNLSLPFENNAFDLVILNGVLEWIPESFSENPREVQKIFLKEIRRILSPNGELYIGIENRFAYTYLLGA